MIIDSSILTARQTKNKGEDTVRTRPAAGQTFSSRPPHTLYHHTLYGKGMSFYVRYHGMDRLAERFDLVSVHSGEYDGNIIEAGAGCIGDLDLEPLRIRTSPA